MNDIYVYPFLKAFYLSNVSISFPTAREADVAYQVLRVDSEPKRSGVNKQLAVKGNLLTVIFCGQKARKVRVGLTSFFESLILITETMIALGSPEPEYNYY